MKSMGKVTLALAVMISSFGCRAASNAPVNGALPHSADNINWVRYTDNAEGAFSMDIPVGWQIDGGMYRFGYFDVRWMMEARSLNGAVIIRVDDPSVPPYVLPGPHSGPAGHPAIRQNLYQMVVDNYRQAQEYAAAYAKRRFASACTTMTPRTADWTPTLPAAWQTESAVKTTQASVAYDCATSDGPRVISVFARDSVIGKEGLWVVDPIISIIAKPADMALAQQMTQRMMDSWQENPQWKQYQDRMTQIGLNQMRGEFSNFMRQMQAYHQQREAAMNQQVSQFEARQNAQAAQVSTWGNILTGTTNLYDPTTGTHFQAFSGPNANYYVNGNGVQVNSNVRPSLDFHQVQNVGP